MLTKAEQSALKVFRQFLITPGQMLCFYGSGLKKHRHALGELTEKGLLVKERFHGGYSLTEAGFLELRRVK